MLALLLCCAVVAGSGGSAHASATDWLPAGHPGISVMFDLSEKENCSARCEHYTLLLRYRSSVPATSSEVAEWSEFAQAGCFDVVDGSARSFACRVPGSISWASDKGQRQATSRFHVRREQLVALSGSGILKLQGLSLRFPAGTKAELRRFLL